MSEPWFDGQAAGLVGGIVGGAVGVWGATVGTLAGLLVPRGRGRGVVFGLLYLGVAAGAAGLVAGLAAAALDQPWDVCYALGYPGFLLLALSVPFVFVMRRRYRLAEERKMAAQDFA